MEGESSTDAWQSWELLTLACSVKKYGREEWDVIANEVQNRRDTPPTYIPAIFSANDCRKKFRDLSLQFSNFLEHQDTSLDDDDETTLKAMIEELTELHMAHLRRTIQLTTIQIESNEMNVKKLEEERPKELDEKILEKMAGTSLSGVGGCSEVEKGNNPDLGNDPVEPVRVENERVWVWGKKGKRSSRRRKFSPVSLGQGKLVDPVDHSKDTETRRLCKQRCNKARIIAQYRPLIRFLQILRRNKYGAVFKRRLPSQDTDKYKQIIKQHVDLQIIQSKLEQDEYKDCNLMFFQDLLLICQNAITFFEKDSQQHLAAIELRAMVKREMAANTLDDGKRIVYALMAKTCAKFANIRTRGRPNKGKKI